MRRIVTLLRVWLPWLGANLGRLAGVVGGVMYVLATIGLVLDSSTIASLAAAPVAALVWTLWLGTIFLVMALPAGAIYLVLLALLRARRATAVVLAPLVGFLFYGGFSEASFASWEQIGWLLAVGFPYGVVVRLPPRSGARRPDEPGAATP